MRKPTHAELDAILGETRAKFDATLTAVGGHLREVEEEFDIAALMAGTGLDLPIDDADIADMLASPSAPVRPAPAPAPAMPISTAPTQKVSIRIKTRTLEAIKSRAKATGRPYQRLVNEVLQTAVREWAAKTHV